MMFLFALSAVLASTAPVLDTKAVQPVVCARMVAEKILSASGGGDPVSIEVPLFTAQQGMTEAQAAEFQRGCDLFEQGFQLGVLVAEQKTNAAPVAAPVDEGESVDHNDEPATKTR